MLAARINRLQIIVIDKADYDTLATASSFAEFTLASMGIDHTVLSCRLAHFDRCNNITVNNDDFINFERARWFDGKIGVH